MAYSKTLTKAQKFERDAYIFRDFQIGMYTSRIADRYGLSISRTNQIIKKEIEKNG